jgi:hypothetical protein
MVSMLQPASVSAVMPRWAARGTVLWPGVGEQDQPGRRQGSGQHPHVVGGELVDVVDDHGDRDPRLVQPGVHGAQHVDAAGDWQGFGLRPGQMPGGQLPGQGAGHGGGRHARDVEVGHGLRAVRGGVCRPCGLAGPGEPDHQPHRRLAREVRFPVVRPIDGRQLREGLQLLHELLVQLRQFGGGELVAVGSGARVLDAGGELPHQGLGAQRPERDPLGLCGAPGEQGGQVAARLRQPRLGRVRPAWSDEGDIRRPGGLLRSGEQVRSRVRVRDHDQPRSPGTTVRGVLGTDVVELLDRPLHIAPRQGALAGLHLKVQVPVVEHDLDVLVALHTEQPRPGLPQTQQASGRVQMLVGEPAMRRRDAPKLPGGEDVSRLTNTP